MPLFGKRKHGDHSDDGFEQHDDNISYRRVAGASADAYIPDVQGIRMYDTRNKDEALEMMQDRYPNAPVEALRKAIDKVFDNARG
jgi:hypothetical protein